ncbi:hypothetical protein GQ600_9507 [Phytophthora cactorum]|nr:hypothetical protein GQ600_9507 [Phytophthora cactorum]
MKYSPPSSSAPLFALIWHSTTTHISLIEWIHATFNLQPYLCTLLAFTVAHVTTAMLTNSATSKESTVITAFSKSRLLETTL